MLQRIRQKATKETQDMKEDLQRKEQIKEAAKKKAEKQADIEAKRRIKAKIEEDKEDRRRKAEEAKALREGRAVESAQEPPAAPAEPKKTVSNASEARLRFHTYLGNFVTTLPAETTLSEVADYVEGQYGVVAISFTTNFPKKVFSTNDFGKTLKEAGMTPSSVLKVN